MQTHTPRVKLSFLGIPRIEIDGELIDLARRKALALLAYLAVTEHECSRDMLATLLWPEEDEQSARGNLRRALACLNATPLRDHVVADRDIVGLQWAGDLYAATVLIRERFQFGG